MDCHCITFGRAAPRWHRPCLTGDTAGQTGFIWQGKARSVVNLNAKIARPHLPGLLCVLALLGGLLNVSFALSYDFSLSCMAVPLHVLDHTRKSVPLSSRMHVLILYMSLQFPDFWRSWEACARMWAQVVAMYSPAVGNPSYLHDTITGVACSADGRWIVGNYLNDAVYLFALNGDRAPESAAELPTAVGRPPVQRSRRSMRAKGGHLAYSLAPV